MRTVEADRARFARVSSRSPTQQRREHRKLAAVTHTSRVEGRGESRERKHRVGSACSKHRSPEKWGIVQEFGKQNGAHDEKVVLVAGLLRAIARFARAVPCEQ